MSEMKTGHSQAGGHERHDINVRKVAIAGVGLLLIVSVVGILTTVVVFKNLAKDEAGEGASPSPMLEAQPLPPEPRLQVNPPLDLKNYRSLEEAQLSSYGWVDKANGVVRLPVDRAMELVLQRGLPVRPDAGIEGQGTPAAGKSPVTSRAAPGQAEDRR